MLQRLLEKKRGGDPQAGAAAVPQEHPLGQRTTPTTIRGGNPKRFRAVAAWRDLRGLPRRKLAEYPLWCFNDDEPNTLAG